MYVELALWQVALAASLVVVNGAVSYFLRLGLERRLLVATVRMIVQLLLIGVALKYIFADGRLVVVLGVMGIMTLIAGVSAVQRAGRRYRGMWLDSVLSVWLSTWLMALMALVVIIQVRPWYEPQYAIPLLGMILGNALNGVSLGVDRLGEELAGKRPQVETLLALGATRWEAAQDALGQAVRTGMLPMINSMMVVGLVSLPGMMTGQMLSGTDPWQAVMYQIVILSLIAAATALGTLGMVLLAYRRLFTPEHQFLAERLVDRRR